MRQVFAAVTALISAFFVFYSVRLLVVTGFLRHVRVGGGGAFVGAAVFPLLALGFAWASVRLWGRAAAVADRRPDIT